MNTRIANRWLVGAIVLFLASASLPAGVVGHWTLDDPAGTAGTGSVIESQYGRNGTPAGTVTFGGAGANANTGTAASFSNSVVHVPFNPDLNPASFTAAAWVYPTGGTSYRSPFTSRYDALGTQGYILYVNPANQWDFWTGSGAGWNGLAGGAAAFNAWSHVAVSFDAATSTKSIYVNGAPANTTAAQGYAPNTVRDLHIGAGGDAGTQYYFPGAVDDFVLFDQALDQAAIQNVMANSVPDPALLSAGKSYAYGQKLPAYSGGTYYFDDSHVQALDTYGTGEATDGAYFPDAGTPTVGPQNEIFGWGQPASQAAEVTIDLEDVFAVSGVTVGTHTFSAYANGSPDDVTLSFSTDGVTFGSPITQAFFTPPNNGHSDFVIDVPGTEARYVKLSFDGGALLAGNTPNKWMLDEISVHGNELADVPEPATMGLLALAATALAGYVRRRRMA